MFKGLTCTKQGIYMQITRNFNEFKELHEIANSVQLKRGLINCSFKAIHWSKNNSVHINYGNTMQSFKAYLMQLRPYKTLFNTLTLNT
jgi:hypothetical protein